MDETTMVGMNLYMLQQDPTLLDWDTKKQVVEIIVAEVEAILSCLTSVRLSLVSQE